MLFALNQAIMSVIKRLCCIDVQDKKLHLIIIITRSKQTGLSKQY